MALSNAQGHCGTNACRHVFQNLSASGRSLFTCTESSAPGDRGAKKQCMQAAW